jgi:hypothetical protein
MIRNIVAAVLIISVATATGYAATNDNATPLPEGVKSSPSGQPSYFEGVWVGSWEGFNDPSIKQDVTLTIKKGRQDGVFIVDYSWGMVQFYNKLIPSGSLKARGRQEGEQFFFNWKNKQGNEQQMTLQKENENKVKARFDRGGTLSAGERPYSETYLNRN